MPLIGQPAPRFRATAAFKNRFKTVDLDDFRDKKYVVLFFYPLDFTFVCPTELNDFALEHDAFIERNAALLACSVDSHFSHQKWLNTPAKEGGIDMVNYPILSDIQKTIATSYDVLHDDGIAYRALFVIDKSGIIRHASYNDLPLGRSVPEVLRILDALQHYEQFGEVCPANWQKGKPAMRPSDEGLKEYCDAFFS